MLFDCLVSADGESLLERPLAERREALEAFHAAESRRSLHLSPGTADRALAEQWLEQSGAALDGVVAKRRDGIYAAGERALLKVKQARSTDRSDERVEGTAGVRAFKSREAPYY